MVKKSVTQSHHISYDPEIRVQIFKGEHWILTQINRRRKFSKGFVKALKVWIVLNEGSAQNLKMKE